jgi:hypothetical protein
LNEWEVCVMCEDKVKTCLVSFFMNKKRELRSQPNLNPHYPSLYKCEWCDTSANQEVFFCLLNNTFRKICNLFKDFFLFFLWRTHSLHKWNKTINIVSMSVMQSSIMKWMFMLLFRKRVKIIANLLISLKLYMSSHRVLF